MVSCFARMRCLTSGEVFIHTSNTCCHLLNCGHDWMVLTQPAAAFLDILKTGGGEEKNKIT
eukprot:2457564-Ditylum_brightwellii.AAC.1